MTRSEKTAEIAEGAKNTFAAFFAVSVVSSSYVITMHLAQVNIGRMRAPLDSPSMHGFVSRLAELNALADRSDGFVWRLQDGEGAGNTYLRPFDDDRIIVNMSVWESVEQLRAFTYAGPHAEILRQRRDWFEKFERVALALWWIPVGHLPTVDEAKQRLASLDDRGPTAYAFTFTNAFPPASIP